MLLPKDWKREREREEMVNDREDWKREREKEMKMLHCNTGRCIL